MILIYESNSEVSERLKIATCMACTHESVVICESYERAILTAMEEEVDLFIVDIMGDSPEERVVSGIEFIRKLRSTDTYRYTDMVIVAEPMDVLYFRLQDLYISGFIYLPVEISSASGLLMYLYKRRKYWGNCTSLRKGSICYRKRNRVEVIVVNDVIWTETHTREYIINTACTKRRFDIRAADEFVKTFENKGFIKINQCDCVNPDYIVGFDYNFVYLHRVNEGRKLNPKGREKLKRLFTYVEHDEIE